MFDTEQLKAIDSRYFNIITVDEYDVTIQGDAACIIFHKHKYCHPYHQHGRGNSLRQAIRSIQSHDRWQMNGRKR